MAINLLEQSLTSCSLQSLAGYGCSLLIPLSTTLLYSNVRQFQELELENLPLEQTISFPISFCRFGREASTGGFTTISLNSLKQTCFNYCIFQITSGIGSTKVELKSRLCKLKRLPIEEGSIFNQVFLKSKYLR